jgi:hypothetical protein
VQPTKKSETMYVHIFSFITINPLQSLLLQNNNTEQYIQEDRVTALYFCHIVQYVALNLAQGFVFCVIKQ